MHRITTFGGVEVRDQSGEVQTFRSRKHVALLIYLRSSPRRVHLRERLIDLFWETEPSLARHSLSQALYDLRSTLGQVVVNCPGDAVRIEADRLNFDVEDLERAVKRGELPRAVEIYTAPFAPDLDRAGTREFEQWLERERARLSVLGQSALRQFLGFADNRGEWGEMCSAALRLIRLNPLDEAAHRALMRGLWLHGDQASALEHFSEVRERLEDDLQDGVSQQTLDLVERIESSRPRAFQGEAAPDRPPPLVGRHAELEALGEFADRQPTASETLLIQGEAGIGKTRLVQELEKLLILDGFTLLQSQCYAAEAEVAYGPVLDGLREVMDNLADLPGYAEYRELARLFPAVNPNSQTPADIPADGQSARRRLFEEIADVLRRYCRDRKVVWVVEDVHCIDGASSALFHYLARRLADEPFRLVLTAHPESQQNEAARGLLDEEFFVETSQVLNVGPLAEEAVTTLVEAVREEQPADPTVVDRIRKLSGGNPFYAVELAKADKEDTELLRKERLYTGKLKIILSNRLRGLDATTVGVLEALCVVHPHTSPSNLKHVLNIELSRLSAATEELERRNIIKSVDGKFTFVHEVLREFVYQDLGLVQRSSLHLAAAEVLAGISDIPSVVVAYHFGKGGDSVRAYEHAARAAREADRRSGCEEAIAIARFGADNAPTASDRFEILSLLAHSQVNCGDYGSAVSTYRELLAIATDLSDNSKQVETRLCLAEAYIELSRWQEAHQTLRAIDNYLSAGGKAKSGDWLKERVEQLRLLITTAIWSKRQNEALKEVDQLKEKLGSATGSVPSAVRLRAVHALAAYQTFCGSLSAARQLLVDSQTLYGDCGDPDIVQKLLILRSGIEEKLGSWDSAEHWLNRALDATRDRRDVLAEAKVSNNFACLALGRGDWETAKDHLSSAISLCSTLPGSASLLITARLNKAKVFFYEGRYSRAYDDYLSLRETLENNRRELSYFEAEIRGGLALAALSCERSEVAFGEWKKVSELRSEALSGVQERFVIYWLESFLLHCSGVEPADLLDDAIRNIDQTDNVSALKLKWIRELFLSKNSGQKKGSSSKLLEEMKNENLYWFARFFERWYRVARTNMESNVAESEFHPASPS